MKFVILITSVLFFSDSKAAIIGSSLSKLYGDRPTVQGESLISIEDAKMDALTAMSDDWVLDYSWSSATVECVESPPIFLDSERNDSTCDWTIPNNRFRFTSGIKTTNHY